MNWISPAVPPVSVLGYLWGSVKFPPRPEEPLPCHCPPFIGAQRHFRSPPDPLIGRRFWPDPQGYA